MCENVLSTAIKIQTLVRLVFNLPEATSVNTLVTFY